MPLVSKVAQDYRRAPGIERIELMQEGVVGLLRALERFDVTLGTPFWAYAAWWVRQAMQQLVAQLTGPVVLSDRAARMLARIKGARRTHYSQTGREASAHELAALTGLSIEHVDRLTAAERKPRALDEPLNADADAGASLIDTVADPTSEQAYDDLPRSLAAKQVPELLEHLSKRERAVVQGRFGISCPERTLRDIGGDLGVSAERVRQIERGALEKLADTAVGFAV
jgi:RNA polymerase sigma factor (sigma-70 family)